MEQPEQICDTRCYAALALLKAPGDEKTRLRAALTTAHRVRLAENMVHHVLQVLDASPYVKNTTLVTPEPQRRHLTLPTACEVLADKDLGGSGINDLANAWQARFPRGTPLLIVHPDLPLLSIGDLAAVTDAHRDADVVLGSDRSGLGTNLLAFHGGTLTQFSFGEDSRRRHRTHCEARGLKVAELRRDGIASDIDLPQDLGLVPHHLAANRVADGTQ